MAGILRCGNGLGMQGKLAHSFRATLAIARSSSNDAASTSGRDLSCSGKPVGFGTLRKGFKPQPKAKRTKHTLSTTQILNGRDKAEVLKETNSEIASQTELSSKEDMWADWKRIDAKVNKYPSERLFTAVGSGGEDFKLAMVRIVEEVVGGPAPPVSVRESSGGAYLSVRVGPVVVQDRDQVLSVFIRMREDKRLKFHL